jgi:hypothetical protein
MTQKTYKSHARSIRANGAAHAIKWITCPFERDDMANLIIDNKVDDYLALRLKWSDKADSVITRALNIKMTSPKFFTI